MAKVQLQHVDGNTLYYPITKVSCIEDLQSTLNKYVEDSELTQALGDYYTKDETYNKAGVDAAIASAVTGGKLDLSDYAKIEWVNEQGFLKAADLTPYAKTADVTNTLKDYYSKNDFVIAEYAKTSEVTETLKDYAKTSEVTETLKPYAKTTEVEEKLEDYYSKEDFKIADYSTTSDVNGLIAAAVAASEKKIFGDGELATAFDTIKEIGDYLENHDDVATGLTAKIAEKLAIADAKIEAGTGADKKKVTLGEYSQEFLISHQNISHLATKEEISDLVSNEELEETLGSYVTSEDLTSTLGDYVTSEDLEADYVSSEDLTSTLGDYVLNSKFTTELGKYVLTTTLTETLADYVKNDQTYKDLVKDVADLKAKVAKLNVMAVEKGAE